jgi:putative ABC transport system permease protein
MSAAYYGQLADVGLIVHGIMAAVFFTLMLIAGNTMVQAVRERTSELAVLKALGFTNASVFGLVLGESVLMCMLGGVVGLICAALSIRSVPALLGTGLLVTSIGPSILARAVALMILMGIAVAVVPAVRAMRLRIVDALR